jgi:hypothetical protein
MVGREDDRDKDRVVWGLEDGAAVCDRARLERNLSGDETRRDFVEGGYCVCVCVCGEAWQLWVQLTERPRPRCLRVRALSHHDAAAAIALMSSWVVPVRPPSLAAWRAPLLFVTGGEPGLVSQLSFISYKLG